MISTLFNKKYSWAVVLASLIGVSESYASDYRMQIPLRALSVAVPDVLDRPAQLPSAAWDINISTAELLSDRLTAYTTSEGVWRHARGTVGMSNGKWYWEMSSTVMANAVYTKLGVSNADFSAYAALGDSSYVGNSLRGYTPGPAWGVNRPATASSDVFMLALDMDAKTLTVGQNGQWWTASKTLGTFAQSAPIVINLPGPVYPMAMVSWKGRATANFGETPFKYAPPAGYRKGLWTQ